MTAAQLIYALVGGLGAAAFAIGLALLLADALGGPDGRLLGRSPRTPAADSPASRPTSLTTDTTSASVYLE